MSRVQVPSSTPFLWHVAALAFREENCPVTDDWLSAEQFERLVVEELDKLPDAMLDDLENVVFATEDAPEDGDRDLLGLYSGVALTRRERYGYGELPDRIVVFRRSLLALASDEAALRDEVHVTLVHEIGHYYGLDDDRLHALGWA